MADVVSFDMCLIKLRNPLRKIDKLKTHLKRRLSEDIADAKRRMRPGGLVEGGS